MIASVMAFEPLLRWRTRVEVRWSCLLPGSGLPDRGFTGVARATGCPMGTAPYEGAGWVIGADWGTGAAVPA